MHELLTVGSIILAIVNVGVMWAMAHQWRYAWHCNLGLQLLWLPYDYLTSQYGLLGLGVIITFVSLKGAYRENHLARAAEGGQPGHRRPRRTAGHAAAAPVRPAPDAEASAPGAGLAGAGSGAGLGGRGNVTVHAGVTVRADAADLAAGTDLAGVSASKATTATGCDEDDRQQSPPVPLIPQQADRRTTLDGQRRPHFQ